jgi:transcriptional regulator with XRE-family HTH domain
VNRLRRPIDPGLSLRLRSAREGAGLTRLTASAALGLSVDTLEDWEHGRTEPRVSDLWRLATTYGVTVVGLLGSDPCLGR